MERKGKGAGGLRRVSLLAGPGQRPAPYRARGLRAASTTLPTASSRPPLLSCCKQLLLGLLDVVSRPQIGFDP
jgi:hypothetical protein